MNLRSFLYRQKQRLNYHFASNDVERQIAEINKYFQRIKVSGSNYFFEEIEMSLPKGKFDYIFQNYPLFVSNAKNLSGNYNIENNQLLFSWDNFKVNISSTSELFIINEIFVEKCYNFLLPSYDKLSVIDLGMNVGLASLYFASLSRVNQVFSYEPFKPTYNLALRNFSLNPVFSNKIKSFNYGLGRKNDTLQLPYNSLNSGINCTVSDNPRLKDADTIELLEMKEAEREILKLLTVTSDESFIVKMDTEGAEYDIFKSICSKGISERIIGFMIEWHFKGPEILELELINAGFKVFSFVINKNAGLIYAVR